MILKIIFLVVTHCSVHTNETEEIIRYKDYKNRVFTLIEDNTTNYLVTGISEDNKTKLDPILNKIYNHFDGDKLKLSSFTSFFLVNYDFNVDIILSKNLYNGENSKAKSKDSSSEINREHNKRDLNMTHLDEVILRFNTKIQEYSFDNLVRVFIPEAYDEEYSFKKAQKVEHSYFYIKMGDNQKFFGDKKNFRFITHSFDENDEDYPDDCTDSGFHDEEIINF